MKTIQYRGALYVEASTPMKHEKCADGTHWNTKQKKCLELPPEILQAKERAHSASREAHRTKSMRDHRAASDAHNEVARLAGKHGFSKFRHSHKQMAGNHALELARRSTRSH